MTRTTLLCGATGLVGSACLRLLAHDPAFARVEVLTRRPLPESLRSETDTTKVAERVVVFDRLSDFADAFAVDAIVCALGTTMRQAGSKERFREVDFGYPLEIARLGVERGATHFLLISAIGANARSRFFYNRVKGELEDAIRALPYRGITIVRPSLLLGERDEHRLGEVLAKRFAFLAPRAWRPVAAEDVAAALVHAAKADAPGHHIIESAEIGAAADEYRAGRMHL
jgi:uncharacterized protein YbjT (DUF2867 family)